MNSLSLKHLFFSQFEGKEVLLARTHTHATQAHTLSQQTQFRLADVQIPLPLTHTSTKQGAVALQTLAAAAPPPRPRPSCGIHCTAMMLWFKSSQLRGGDNHHHSSYDTKTWLPVLSHWPQVCTQMVGTRTHLSAEEAAVQTSSWMDSFISCSTWAVSRELQA
uniref:Uncharacterized protein n=1 Tax=Sphaerodactylus townsendi TaxID=933632 RepID=A0ACB8EC24_9SAUR